MRIDQDVKLDFKAALERADVCKPRLFRTSFVLGFGRGREGQHAFLPTSIHPSMDHLKVLGIPFFKKCVRF